FRREIARYHPGKVQHLGAEFQEMAAGIAADLTEAYRILMDPALRAKYDADLGSPAAGPPPPAPTPEPPPAPAPHADVPPPPRPSRGSAGIDFVRRVSLSKIREAIPSVLA